MQSQQARLGIKLDKEIHKSTIRDMKERDAKSPSNNDRLYDMKKIFYEKQARQDRVNANQQERIERVSNISHNFASFGEVSEHTSQLESKYMKDDLEVATEDDELRQMSPRQQHYNIEVEHESDDADEPEREVVGNGPIHEDDELIQANDMDVMSNEEQADNDNHMMISNVDERDAIEADMKPSRDHQRRRKHMHDQNIDDAN